MSGPANRLTRLVTALVPAGALARRLTAASLIASVGFGLYGSGSLLYFTRVAGLSLTQVGLGLSIAGAAGFAMSIPAGWAADRLGPRKVTVAMCCLQAAVLAVMLLSHGPAAFFVLICLLGIAEQAGNVARGALIARVVDKADRVRTMAAVRSTFNVGITLGALLAGIAFAVDTEVAYASLLVGTGVAAVLAAVVYRWVPEAPAAAAPRTRRLSLFADVPYTVVALFCGVVSISDTALAIGIPLWTVNFTAAPRPLAAWAIAVNTVLVVVLQVWASRGADSPARCGRLLIRALGAMTVACALLAATRHASAVVAGIVLIAGVVVLTFGELWMSAAGWGLRYGLAPDDRQGAYGGLFSLGSALRAMLGPAVLTALLQGMQAVGWLVLGGAFAIAAVTAGPLTRHAIVTRPRFGVVLEPASKGVVSGGAD